MSSSRTICLSFSRLSFHFNVCVYVYATCVVAHRGPERALDPSHAPQLEARVIGSCESPNNGTGNYSFKEMHAVFTAVLSFQTSSY